MAKSCYSRHPTECRVTLPKFGLSTDCWLRQDWKGKEDLDTSTTSKLLNKVSQRVFLEANWHERASIHTAKLTYSPDHSGHIQNTCWNWSLTQVDTQAVPWHCLEEHKQTWAKIMPGTNFIVWMVSGPCLVGSVQFI